MSVAWARAEDGDVALVANLLEHVARVSGVPVPALLSPRRALRYVEPRHVAMYLARELTDLSWHALAEIFQRDHTTLLFAHRKVRDGMSRRGVDSKRIHDLAKQVMRDMGVES
mgnify:CR=1 FL=1